jgi:hypothetical protein
MWTIKKARIRRRSDGLTLDRRLDWLLIGCTGLLTIAVTEIAKRMECGES